MDSSKIPGSLPKRTNSTGSSSSGSGSSSDSGISSPPDTPSKTPEAFLRETQEIDVTPKMKAPEQELALPELSYKNLERRNASPFYNAQYAGQGWDEHLLHLLKQGSAICGAYNVFSSFIGNAVTEPRCDRTLQTLLIMFGKSIPEALGGAQGPSSMRESVIKTLADAGLEDKWEDIELCTREILNFIALGAAMAPISKTELDEIEKEYNEAFAAVTQLTNQAQTLSRRGKKRKTTKSDEKAIAKFKAVAEKRTVLLEEHQKQLQARVTALGDSKEKLKFAVDDLSAHFRKKFSPCNDAARSDVLVPQTSAPDETRIVIEKEKVSGDLLLCCGSLPETLMHFTKNYYLFHEAGGRAKMIEKGAEQTVKINVAMLEAAPAPPLNKL